MLPLSSALLFPVSQPKRKNLPALLSPHLHRPIFFCHTHRSSIGFIIVAHAVLTVTMFNVPGYHLGKDGKVYSNSDADGEPDEDFWEQYDNWNKTLERYTGQAQSNQHANQDNSYPVTEEQAWGVQGYLDANQVPREHIEGGHGHPNPPPVGYYGGVQGNAAPTLQEHTEGMQSTAVSTPQEHISAIAIPWSEEDLTNTRVNEIPTLEDLRRMQVRATSESQGRVLEMQNNATLAPEGHFERMQGNTSPSPKEGENMLSEKQAFGNIQRNDIPQDGDNDVPQEVPTPAPTAPDILPFPSKTRETNEAFYDWLNQRLGLPTLSALTKAVYRKSGMEESIHQYDVEQHIPGSTVNIHHQMRYAPTQFAVYYPEDRRLFKMIREAQCFSRVRVTVTENPEEYTRNPPCTEPLQGLFGAMRFLLLQEKALQHKPYLVIGNSIIVIGEHSTKKGQHDHFNHLTQLSLFLRGQGLGLSNHPQERAKSAWSHINFRVFEHSKYDSAWLLFEDLVPHYQVLKDLIKQSPAIAKS
jgi:hypothetical protein